MLISGGDRWDFVQVLTNSKTMCGGERWDSVKVPTIRKTNMWPSAQILNLICVEPAYYHLWVMVKLVGHEFKSHVGNIPDVHINRFQNVVRHCW